MKKVTCTKRYTDLPFAHRQPNHEGHCRFIHGHNWTFEFEFDCAVPDDCGFVMDFGDLKQVKEWLGRTFDHTLVINHNDPLNGGMLLHDLLHFVGNGVTNLKTVPDCSCEGIAAFAFEKVNSMVDEQTDGRVMVIRCTVYEDSKNSATVYCGGGQ